MRLCLSVWTFSPVKFRLWNGLCARVRVCEREHVLYELITLIRYKKSKQSKMKKSSYYCTWAESIECYEHNLCTHTHISSHTIIIFHLKNGFCVSHICPSPFSSFSSTRKGSRECTACEIIIEQPLNWFQFLYPFKISKKKKGNTREWRMKEQQFHWNAFGVPDLCV